MIYTNVVLQRTLESPLDCKEIQPVHPKGNQPWIFIGWTDAEAEAPILWPPDVKSWLIRKRSWCWERLKTGGEGDNRERDGWIASPTQWTWVWASSGRWWRTGRPDVLPSMGLQRVGHDWAAATKLILVESASASEVPQSCLTLRPYMDYSLPESSIHGIFQARVLEWVAISFSRRSSWPRDWTRVSRIAGTRFTIWAIREVCNLS